MNKYIVVNILDFKKYIGNDALNKIISNFSCDKNKEIETFIKKNAVDFANKKTAMTYLIFNKGADFIGYFTLALKSVVIKPEFISKTSSNRLKQFVKPDENGCFNVPIYLIAQFGKNFSKNLYKKCDGKELFDEAIKILLNVQKEIGGIVSLLETTDNKKLMNFYSNECKYVECGYRYDKKDNIKYIQMLKFI